MEAENKVNVENFYEDLLFDLLETGEKSNTINGIDPKKILPESRIIVDNKDQVKLDIGNILNFFHPERKCAYSDKEDNGLLWIDLNRKNLLITNLIRVNTEHIEKIGIGKFVYIARSEDLDIGLDNIIITYKTLLPCSIDGETYLNEGFNQYVIATWKGRVQRTLESDLPNSYKLIYLWKVFSHAYKLKGLREIILKTKNEDPLTPSAEYSMNYMELLNITNNRLFE